MKNNWYYRFLGVVVFWVVSVNLQAQSDSLLLSSDLDLQVQSNDFLQNSDLKRKGFKLATETSVLEKEQLKTMLSENQFRGYNHARRCYIASIPMLSLGAGFTTLGFVFLYKSYHVTSTGIAFIIESGLTTLLSYAFLGYGVAYLVSGVVLITHSAIRLNNIAENYNKQRHSSYFQNGLQLNLGFVDNGIGVKLRF